MVGIGSRISADQVELRDGNKELGASVVGNPKVLVFPFACFDGLQAHITTDAVFGMYDRVSGRKFPDVANRRFERIGCRATPPKTSRGFKLIDLSLGNKSDFGIVDGKARTNRCLSQANGSG